MADIGNIQLSAFWKQPTDQYGSYEVFNNQATYREQWKGSMSDVVTLYNRIQSWKPEGTTDAYTYSKFKLEAAAIAPLCAYYDPPAAPVSADWTLQTAEVQENEAGDNAFLNLTWGVNTIEVTPGEETQLNWETRWSVSWLSQSVTLYEYCGNTGKHIDNPQDAGMRGKIASRTAIESWFNQPQEYGNVKFDYKYNDGQNVRRDLNGAEKNIASKMLLGKSNPIFHYPILTKTLTAEFPKKQYDTAIGKVSYECEQSDIIGNPLPPFDIPLYPGISAWSWLCQGSNVGFSENKRTEMITVTITTSWWGSKEWDENFYGDGDDRWLFGEA